MSLLSKTILKSLPDAAIRDIASMFYDQERLKVKTRSPFSGIWLSKTNRRAFPIPNFLKAHQAAGFCCFSNGAADFIRKLG
jgi:hypothetical protein